MAPINRNANSVQQQCNGSAGGRAWELIICPGSGWIWDPKILIPHWCPDPRSRFDRNTSYDNPRSVALIDSYA